MSNDTIDSIEKFACDIVNAASKTDVKLDQQIEAMKAITPIYTALRRHHKDDNDGDGDENTFDKFRSQIKEHGNGTPPVRSGRGRRDQPQ